MKNKYSKHQRDYTLLGTSVVFNSFCGEGMTKYFSLKSSPLYILIKNNILYHFISENDAKNRATSWMKKYRESSLVNHKQKHDVLLKKYKKFIKEKHKDFSKSLLILHNYFIELLPLIMVAIEVPEYFAEKISNKTLQLCFKIREQNEFVYKTGFEVQNKLLNSLEKERGIENNTLQYLTMPEFNNFIKTNKLPKNIDARKDFVFIKKTATSEVISRNKQILSKLGLIEDVSLSQNEFKGNVAFKGVVRGKVKLITFIGDADETELGDILVTSMTDPRYLPAMRIASAFVTDEGGITCHAAIVARELKKPCIIGTKIATKVLKDGDLVEVDAEKGVVTILKKVK